MTLRGVQDFDEEFIEEINSYNIVSWIKAALINSSDCELDSKIINSNNHYAYDQLEPLLDEDIKKERLNPRVTSTVRSLLSLPDSSYVARNRANYGMELGDIDKQLLSEAFMKDEMRLFGLLMHYFSQDSNVVSEKKFNDKIINCSKGKQPEFFKDLGNNKAYREALNKYRPVAHLMLARSIITKNDYINREINSVKSGLEIILTFACYFQTRLLALSNKHSIPKNLFLLEDFGVV